MRVFFLYREDWENFHKYLTSQFSNDPALYIRDCLADFDDPDHVPLRKFAFPNDFTQRNWRAKLAVNIQTPVQVDSAIGQVFIFWVQSFAGIFNVNMILLGC